MDAELLERLLYRGESETLDFKVDQYAFEKATDDEKGELLKDILAFANAWRDTDAHILIGVNAVTGARAQPVGITKAHLDDAALHQFVNARTHRPLAFKYEALQADGKDVAVITISKQERPFYLKAPCGKLKANTVYIRRGSSTGEAAPDEIAKMGREPAALARLLIAAEIVFQPGEVPEGKYWLHLRLSNTGRATAHELTLEFLDQPNPGSISWESSAWEYLRGRGTNTIMSKHPLHPGGEVQVARWCLGKGMNNLDELINLPYGSHVVSGLRPDPARLRAEYEGKPVHMKIHLFARDQSLVGCTVDYTKKEIEDKHSKAIPCEVIQHTMLTRSAAAIETEPNWPRPDRTL